MSSVKTQFDSISREWADYRKTPVPILNHFLGLMPPHAVVLDAGCGSGRNLREIAKKAEKVFGVDFSPQMLCFAEKNLPADAELVEADLCAMPFPNGLFDAVFYIASLHHLERKKHSAAFKEMARVLKNGGLAFITVWNRHQKKFAGMKKAALVPWTLEDGKRVQRFYHFFEASELQKLAEKSGFTVLEIFYEKSGFSRAKEGAANLCLVLKKK